MVQQNLDKASEILRDLDPVDDLKCHRKVSRIISRLQDMRRGPDDLPPNELVVNEILEHFTNRDKIARQLLLVKGLHKKYKDDA